MEPITFDMDKIADSFGISTKELRARLAASALFAIASDARGIANREVADALLKTGLMPDGSVAPINNDDAPVQPRHHLAAAMAHIGEIVRKEEEPLPSNIRLFPPLAKRPRRPTK